jgi:hypothetical protein
MDDLSDEELLRRCVFLARYQRRRPGQWVRVGRPAIETADDPWPAAYDHPQVRVSGEGDAEVRVWDDKAVDLSADVRVADYDEAVARCDLALLRAFPDDIIAVSRSDW